MLPAVILAAGASSRMGQPKALLPIGSRGETFLSRIVATLREAGLRDVAVVLGHDAPSLRPYLDRELPDVRAIVNPEPAGGQVSSLLAALTILDRPGVRALLFSLVDHPLVAPSTVRAVIETYQRTAAPIVRPARSGRHGHPVIFDRRVFDALRRADPTHGAKAIIRAYANEVVDVEVDDEGAFTDIDTPEDYERVFGVSLRSSN